MADDFETNYMASESAVHRDKRVSRTMVGILAASGVLTWGLGAFIVAINGSSPNPVPASMMPVVLIGMALLGLVFMGLGVTLGVLRTLVTGDQVIVKYGLWGPEIALASITACKVVDYDWKQFGGWGIRRGRGGVLAYVPGPGEVVEIKYDVGGSQKTVFVGAQDARALSLAINQTRGAQGQLRITDDTQAELDRHIEQEFEAEDEHEDDDADRRAGQ